MSDTIKNRAVVYSTKGILGNWRHAFNLRVQFTYAEPNGTTVKHSARADLVFASWEFAEYLLTPPSRHNVEGERLRYELNTGVWSANLGGWCVPLVVHPSSVQWTI